MDPSVSGHDHRLQIGKTVGSRLNQSIGIEPEVKAIETSNSEQFLKLFL